MKQLHICYQPNSEKLTFAEYLGRFIVVSFRGKELLYYWAENPAITLNH